MKKISYLLMSTLIFSFACGGGGSESKESNEAEAEEMVMEEAPMETPKDIVALASETESLSTLVAAVKAAGLVETLQGEGPFTVFAPTNEAFAALPEGTLDNLLLPENKDQLVAILTYHVVPGAVKSTDLTAGMSVATVNGANVTFDIVEGVEVNGAIVLTADITASNGIVHVIDSVILPPAE